MNSTIVSEVLVYFKNAISQSDIPNASIQNFLTGISKHEKSWPIYNTSSKEEIFIREFCSALNATERVTSSNLPDMTFKSLQLAHMPINYNLSKALHSMYTQSNNWLDELNGNLDLELYNQD